LLGNAAADDDVRALGDDPARWRAYRRMVRSRFYQTIDHAFERLIGVIGEGAFHAHVDRFLADDPPRSPYLRDVPGEFLRWFERSGGDAGLVPYALDLMRYEWAELDTAYSHDEAPSQEVAPLDMERPPVLAPAHRLLTLEYPVHHVGLDGSGRPAAPGRVSLCLYRDPRTHEVETLELTPVAATLLAAIQGQSGEAAEGASLSTLVRRAAAAHEASIDVAFVEALSTLLADLTERGVLLGSLARMEK
jgi:hypothetical protein